MADSNRPKGKKAVWPIAERAADIEAGKGYQKAQGKVHSENKTKKIGKQGA
jgi:hypothetical protein